jgi:O-antigen ligase
MSIPLSKFTMSVTEFMLLGLWLWSGFSFTISFRFFKLGGVFKGFVHFIEYVAVLAYRNFIDQIAAFIKHKPALILSSIYLLHIVGLFYTTDMDYALKDLRVKLPLLLFPIVFVSMEKIGYKRFRVMMLFYAAASLVGTFISFSLMLKGNFVDIREISPFISPIRFGLNICFAFFTLIYFILFDDGFKIWHKITFGFVLIWFLIFLILLESLTSLWILLIVSIIYLVILLFKTQKLSVKLAFIVLAIGIPVSLFFYVKQVIDRAQSPPVIDATLLETHTEKGNLYIHDTVVRGIENGRYIGLYMCMPEVKQAWNEVSTYDFYSKTDAGEEIKETLVRYLTSKDLRKDAQGVYALTDWDVRMIEKGVANYNYVKKPGLRTRILKIIMGYDVYKKTGDPSGSSVMQRIEYSKASFKLIAKNFWTGVGTGDIESKLINQYTQMGSELKTKFRFHAHNQFLAIFITFGVFGFLWFIFALLYPAIKLKGFNDYFFVSFFLIIIFSMFSDDTIETQAGATLFAFFYSFLLLGKKRENTKSALKDNLLI